MLPDRRAPIVPDVTIEARQAFPPLGSNGAVDELRRRNTELEALHETTLGLIEGLDLAVVLDAIIDRAGRLIGTPHGYLYLVEEDGDVLRSEVATGALTVTIGLRVERGEGLAGRVLETGAPLVVDHYRSWEHRLRAVDHLNIGSLVGVPLRAGVSVTGVIGLAFMDDARSFGRPELAVLERFARLASLALNNAKIYAALKEELGERTRAEEDLHQAIAQLRRSEAELHVSREEMIRRLAWAIEFRDTETGRHTERMGQYCCMLARRLGLDEEHCELIRVASGLHDIGKIAIPDSILLKSGELTPEERALAERHTVIGHTILAGSASPLLELAATIALTHHEWFDGAGYPNGLGGEGIPLEGRIAAVADVFDALTNDRPYRRAYAPEEAFELMARERGGQFDPILLDLFFDSAEMLATGHVSPEPVPCSKPVAQRPPADSKADLISPSVLAAAAESALAALRSVGDDGHCFDAALGALVESGGRHLLPSVYVVDTDRLWLVAQQGYDQVRDGFRLDQGVIARTVRTGEPQFLPDVSTDPDFIAAANSICSEVAIPFGGSSPAAGVLNLETRDRVLPPESVAILAELARGLGDRVERMRRGVGADVASLARLFVEASLLRGVGQISEFACRTLGRLLGLEAAQVSIMTSRGDFAIERFWRRSQSLLEPLTSEDLARAAREAGAIETTCSILDLDSLGIGRREGEESSHRLIWLSLRVGGKELGVLVGRAPTPLHLTQDQIEAATLVAQHAASLLDAALALRREQRAAVTDELTGLLNRRGFRDRFREELDRCVRTDGSLALVMHDCDDLKAVNDRGGHEVGDAVLQMIGEFLRTEKRREDIAARLGGDEFGLVIPDGTTEIALAVAERLRRALIERALESGHPITATFGVAACPSDGVSLVDLLRAADRAMYRGKLEGKNRTLAVASSP
jgi:diguanylate cyclase (GGDEF)-like protein